jgi:hypothetical protein
VGGFRRCAQGGGTVGEAVNSPLPQWGYGGAVLAASSASLAPHHRSAPSQWATPVPVTQGRQLQPAPQPGRFMAGQRVR